MLHARVLEELGKNPQKKKSNKQFVKSGQVIGNKSYNWVCQIHLIEVNGLREN